MRKPIVTFVLMIYIVTSSKSNISSFIAVIEARFRAMTSLSNRGHKIPGVSNNSI